MINGWKEIWNAIGTLTKNITRNISKWKWNRRYVLFLEHTLLVNHTYKPSGINATIPSIQTSK